MYWKLKEDALDFTFWRNRFGRGCRTVVRLRDVDDDDDEEEDEEFSIHLGLYTFYRKTTKYSQEWPKRFELKVLQAVRQQLLHEQQQYQ